MQQAAGHLFALYNSEWMIRAGVGARAGQLFFLRWRTSFTAERCERCGGTYAHTRTRTNRDTYGLSCRNKTHLASQSALGHALVVFRGGSFASMQARVRHHEDHVGRQGAGEGYWRAPELDQHRLHARVVGG